jgi:hypothetical protein
MISKLKLTILSVLSLGFLAAAPLVVVGAVSAQPDIQNSLCQGGGTVQLGDPAECATTTDGAEEGLNGLITNIVNIFSIIVGIVAVVMIIIGGFRYITSGGDSGNVTAAKNTILYAVIGLVIVALAQFIVRFVLSKSTDLTT